MLRDHPNRPPHEVNPHGEPFGHFTGRCLHCQSKDLWEDGLWYGCNNCGAFFSPDHNPQPRIIPNARQEEA